MIVVVIFGERWIKNQPKINKYVFRCLIPATVLCYLIYAPAFNNYSFRTYNSKAKASLHSLYLACKAYWADKGAEKNCDVETASQPAYGFILSDKVILSLRLGKKSDFEVMAKHKSGDITFFMDSNGNIRSEYKN